jgi:hypothetical protein
MTWKRLLVTCAVGALTWALILFAGFRYGWGEAGKWAVMIVFALWAIGTIWLKVEKDQDYLDELEAQREAEGLDYDEYEQPLPPAA